MTILDWLLQTLFPKKSSTWRDAFAADNDSGFSAALQKELKNNGNEKKILKAVLSEFRVLHPDIDVSDSVLKEVILASLYSSQRVSSLSEAFPFLPPKEAQEITGDISFALISIAQNTALCLPVLHGIAGAEPKHAPCIGT